MFADSPPEESDRETSSDPFNIQASALGGTTYYGASAEVNFPIFGLPKEVGLKGALFADAGNLIGYGGPTNFSNFLGYTFCPPPNSIGRVFPTTQLSCSSVWDPESNPRVGGSKFDLGLADGPDSL